jgi:hypothetical protein
VQEMRRLSHLELLSSRTDSRLGLLHENRFRTDGLCCEEVSNSEIGDRIVDDWISVCVLLIVSGHAT